MVGMSDKEKEKQGKLVVFDKAKEFMSNLTAIMDVDEDWDWILRYDKFTLSDGQLTLKFKLKDGVIEDAIQKLDKAQRKVDDPYPEEAKVLPE
jgi:hypothetical protein